MAKAATTLEKTPKPAKALKADQAGKAEKAPKSEKKKKKKARAADAGGAPKKAGKKARNENFTEEKPERHSRLDGLARLADHPMVADLLTVGAVAAVAAIAEQQVSSTRPANSQMVKSAGKAAAAAIGRKLMGDFGSIAGAATDAAKKA